MGAFRTISTEPLHQPIAILPMHIRLQMLSKPAALSLLVIPHSSQLIQCLGPPVQRGGAGCGAPTPLRIHRSSGSPRLYHPTQDAQSTFARTPGRGTTNLPHLRVLSDFPKGEDRKLLAAAIKTTATTPQNNTLLLFCQGCKLCNNNNTPTGMAVCVAWRQGVKHVKIGHSVKCLSAGAMTQPTRPSSWWQPSS
jgi:hypothetical protein